MRPLFSDVERDPDTGAIILGDPDAGCPYCGAAAEPTYSGCGRVAWWHPPLECCDRRKAMNRKAWFAATNDRAAQDEADRLANRTPTTR